MGRYFFTQTFPEMFSIQLTNVNRQSGKAAASYPDLSGQAASEKGKPYLVKG